MSPLHVVDVLSFRWYNNLDPAIRKDAWTDEEEQTLAYYHQIFGNKWADIARFLPGRYGKKRELEFSTFI